MPFVRLETTESLSLAPKTKLCAALSRVCAESIGKPEAYVMAVVVDGVTMLHAGRAGPAAFIEVRSIGGLSAEVNRRLAQELCALVSDMVKVQGDRIYLNFSEVAATHWAHDGDTFA